MSTDNKDDDSVLHIPLIFFGPEQMPTEKQIRASAGFFLAFNSPEEAECIPGAQVLVLQAAPDPEDNEPAPPPIH